jgi:hypothetical protein
LGSGRGDGFCCSLLDCVATTPERCSAPHVRMLAGCARCFSLWRLAGAIAAGGDLCVRYQVVFTGNNVLPFVWRALQHAAQYPGQLGCGAQECSCRRAAASARGAPAESLLPQHGVALRRARAALLAVGRGAVVAAWQGRHGHSVKVLQYITAGRKVLQYITADRKVLQYITAGRKVPTCSVLRCRRRQARARPPPFIFLALQHRGTAAVACTLPFYMYSTCAGTGAPLPCMAGQRRPCTCVYNIATQSARGTTGC